MHSSRGDRDRAQRAALVGAAVALTAVTAFSLHYARTHRPNLPVRPVPVASGLPPDTEIRLEGTSVNGRDPAGKPAWTVRAKQVDTDRTRTRIRFEGGIDARLLDSDGSGSVRAFVTAPRALFTETTKSLEVGGTVTCRVPGEKGKPEIKLTAKALRWDVGQNRVVCSGEVTAQMERDTIRAGEMTVDLRTQELNAKDIQARFYVGQDEPSLPFGKLPL